MDSLLLIVISSNFSKVKIEYNLMINTIKHLIKGGMLSSQFYIPKRHELIIITNNNNNNNNILVLF